MKALIIFVLSLKIFTSLASAGLVEDQKTICQSSEILNEMRNDEFCRVLLVVKANETKQGSCQGKALGLVCMISYSIKSTGTMVNILCGKDFSSPSVNQTMSAQTLSYDLFPILGNEAGEERPVSDPKSKFEIDNHMINLSISEEDGKVQGRVILKVQAEPAELADIRCH